MDETWVLIADRARARILAKSRSPFPEEREWRELEPLVYPEARAPNQDFTTAKPGRSFDRKGSGRHAMTTEIDPKEEAAERFARTLAEVLDKGRTHHLYESLILVAEPGFLGILQAKLPPQTAKKVIDRIPKDLTTRPHKALTEDLRSWLRPR